MTDRTISVLGCGWLGRPLGARLAAEGARVRGSTTTPAKVGGLRADGIEPFVLRLDPNLALEPAGRHEGEDADAAQERFFGSDVLVLNVPPPRGRDDGGDHHRRQIGAVQRAAAAGGVAWVIFASSTGVYPSADRTVSEEDVAPGGEPPSFGTQRATGALLQDIEGRLLEADGFETTVLRFAGLYGGDRHPGRFLAGRTGLARPEGAVNLIHRDDCIGIVMALLAADDRSAVVGEAFNACADAHPSRRVLYTRAAEALGLDPPTFDESDASTGKVVDNRKLKDALGYRYRHPDPLADLSDAQ
jgi:nucleoside-diphosphate-sugar epimerase